MSTMFQPIFRLRLYSACHVSFGCSYAIFGRKSLSEIARLARIIVGGGHMAVDRTNPRGNKEDAYPLRFA